MKSLFKRGAFVAVTTAACLAVGTVVAVAATSHPLTLSTTGVKFSGSYVFYASGTNDGGLGYPGNICDTSADGNSVFVHAKVEGYGYGSKTYDKKGNSSCQSENMYSYAPGDLYVNYGWVQACQDRGTLVSDLCKASDKLER
ncbi:hypothetical protein GCM10023221_19130 [Luteimicrobium xylanilyticum]|uniref:Uncharacterized protein n=1 Tax=Luteimicrobium xylanilyticum TaxID=1133546 RepID=A0A5P9Q8S3_9MICO|nr:hypothetical protein [Luteimicrobium xylanilyticum]QFU97843.1 hypothetical protein KDY119_01349 [Luteimicrobium xylanilyticum]